MEATPTRAPARAPLFDAGVTAGVAVLGALAAVVFAGVRHDDAYITFRYAENLARGLGPVFNPGERVLGTTAPGHMLLAALLYGVAGKAALPSAMAVLGCLGWTAQALGVFALLRVGFSRAVAAAAALAVALGAAGSAEVVALETNLVAACVVWCLALLLRGRTTAAAVLAACAGLLRPDAYLLALLAGGFILWRERRVPVRPALAFAAITLPWQLFAFGYYGSVIPQSARTKFAQTAFGDYFVHELHTAVAALAPAGAGAWATVAAWLVLLAGAVVLVRRGRGLWLLPAYAAAHLLAYAWLRPFKEHVWHLYPLQLAAAVLAAAALGALFERLRRPAARGAVAVAAVALLAVYATSSARFARAHATSYWFGARDAAYQEASAFLRRHARPDDVVAAVEVGTIGYWSGLAMDDRGGLVTASDTGFTRTDWIVVDDLCLGLAGGLLPARVFEAHGFRASVFNIEWMSRATRRAQPRFPGVPLRELLTRHPDAIGAELAAIVAEAEARAEEGAAAGSRSR